MGRSVRLAEPETEKRVRIICAARELFTTQGFESTTMAQIAARAEVSVGTLYHYFESKRDLLVELAMESGRQIAQALFTPGIRAIPLAQRVQAMIDATFRACAGSRDEIGLLHLYLDPETEVDRWARFADQIIQPLTQFIQEGIDAGVFRPTSAEMTARLIYAMVDGALQQCFVYERGAREDAYKAGLTEMMNRMVLAPAAAVREESQTP
jgi:AcrR family transcriptional regulator